MEKLDSMEGEREDGGDSGETKLNDDMEIMSTETVSKALAMKILEE